MKNLPRSVKWLLFGVACYLIIALFTAPARLMLNLVGPDNLSASNVSGSAWNGKADSISFDNFRSEDVRWDFSPSALLTLKAGAEINAKIPGGSVRSNVAKSLFSNSGQAEDLKGVVALGEFATALNLPLLIDGKAGLQLDKIKWTKNRITDIEGDVILGNLTDKTTNSSLGSFEISFAERADSTITGIVKDTDSVIKLDGSIKLNEDGSYNFDATVVPTNDTPSSIVSAIQLIGGSPDAQGGYKLSYNGSL